MRASEVRAAAGVDWTGINPPDRIDDESMDALQTQIARQDPRLRAAFAARGDVVSESTDRRRRAHAKNTGRADVVTELVSPEAVLTRRGSTYAAGDAADISTYIDHISDDVLEPEDGPSLPAAEEEGTGSVVAAGVLDVASSAREQRRRWALGKLRVRNPGWHRAADILGTPEGTTRSGTRSQGRIVVSALAK